MGHAAQKAANQNQADPRKQSKDDYLNTKIANEVQAEQTRHQVYSELKDKNAMSKPYEHLAWEKANPSERNTMIHDQFDGPKPVFTPSTTTTGERYRTHYGKEYDRLHSQPPPKP